MAGQQLKRVASGLVRTRQPAEAHIVTGRILNAVKNAFLTQAKNKIVLQLRVDADGNVVGPQLKIGVLLEDAEVLFDLRLAAQCIEGSGCNDAQSSTDFFNCLDVLNNTLSFGIDHTNQQRNAAVDNANNLALDLLTTLGGRECNLTGRAGDEEAVQPRTNHAVDVALQRGNVQLAVLQRDSQRRDNAANL